jgi:hypothetical protein
MQYYKQACETILFSCRFLSWNPEGPGQLRCVGGLYVNAGTLMSNRRMDDGDEKECIKYSNPEKDSKL